MMISLNEGENRKAIKNETEIQSAFGAGLTFTVPLIEDGLWYLTFTVPLIEDALEYLSFTVQLIEYGLGYLTFSVPLIHTQLKNTKSIKGLLIPVSYKTPAVLLIIKSRKSIVGY
jgi:hypothetical protein